MGKSSKYFSLKMFLRSPLGSFVKNARGAWIWFLLLRLELQSCSQLSVQLIIRHLVAQEKVDGPLFNGMDAQDEVVGTCL